MDPEFPIPARIRESLEFQLVQEFYRLSPELRAAVAETGSGGIHIPFRREDWPAVLNVLRALPDDPGQEALARALAPFPQSFPWSDGEQAV